MSTIRPVWKEAISPRPVGDVARYRVLENAFLTPLEIRSVEGGVIPAIRWTRGAVYDSDGVLQPESLRIGGLGGDKVLAVDEPTLEEALDRLPEKDRRQGPQRHPGLAIYAGNWMGHFGHFLSETLTSLWPLVDPQLRAEVTGRGEGAHVAHHFIFGPKPQDFMDTMTSPLGLKGPVTLATGPGLRVDRLLLPVRGYVPNGYALPEAVATWRLVGKAYQRKPKLAPRRIYLSRTRFHEEQIAKGVEVPRRIVNEAGLDDLMAARGFTVVHPEQLDVAEQIGLMARAEVVAGASGSALHLAAFAPGPIHVLEMGDLRSTSGLPNQMVIDAACGHRAAHLRFQRKAGTDALEHDLPVVAELLDELFTDLPAVERPGRLKGLFRR